MSSERGKRATMGGIKMAFNPEETSGNVCRTHTDYKAQDGWFMMMGAE